MSRDNAGQRVLSARKRTRDHESSLHNTYGLTLPDGAQCWVIEEQHNYRFIKDCQLHADGKFVVMPVDEQGRWVREAGLVGFAMLTGGKPDNDGHFLGFEGPLVQFALSLDGVVTYTGAVPRMVAFECTCDSPIMLVHTRGSARMALVSSERCAGPGVQYTAMVLPGDRFLLLSDSPNPELQASFNATLL